MPTPSNAAADTEHEIMTTQEVAAFLRQPVSTVRYWRTIGYGPKSRKIGKRCTYKRIDVRRWYDNQ